MLPYEFLYLQDAHPLKGNVEGHIRYFIRRNSLKLVFNHENQYEMVSKGYVDTTLLAKNQSVPFKCSNAI